MADTIVNSTTLGDQTEPTVASLADGRYIVVWTSSENGQTDIRARYFNADHTPAGDDFVVNTTTAGGQIQPTVTTSPIGGVTIAWATSTGLGFDIRARSFASDGTPISNDFAVNTIAIDNQMAPTIATLADGRTVVMWWTNDFTSDIRARIFNPDGSPATSDFQINSTTPGDQRAPDVVALPDGRFVATYNHFNGSDLAVYARIFSSDGIPEGPDFRVSTTSTISISSVAAFDDGRFVIAWDKLNGSNGFDIEAQVYGSDGTALGTTFAVGSTVAGDQRNPEVVTLSDGRFVIVWNSQEGGQQDIRGRIFNADASPDGADFVINSTTTGDQQLSSIASLADGDVIVTWQSSDAGDGSGMTIRSEVISINYAPVITSNGGGDTAIVSSPENTTFVAALSATDIDTNQALSWTITGGANAGFFEIRNGNELHFRTAPDFEAPAPAHDPVNNTFTVEVQVADTTGATDRQLITVNVADVNEAPRLLPPTVGPELLVNGSFETGFAGWSVAGNAEAIDTRFDAPNRQSDGFVFANFNGRGGPAGGTIAQTFATEPGKTYVVSFDAGVNGSGNTTNNLRVEVVGATSRLDTTIVDSTPSTAGNGGSYSPYEFAFTADSTTTTLRFTDQSTGQLLSVDLQLDHVSVREVGYSVAENTTSISSVAAVDPDAGQNLSYSIAGGADAARFAINSTTGALSFIAAPDFEAPSDAGGDNVYDVIVEVSDGNGGTDTQALSVRVTDADEIAPRLVSLVASDSSPTSASVVEYIATFSEAVFGVDTSQFALTSFGVSGAAITSVTPVAGSNGTQYTVSVATGTGDGSIGLTFTGATVADGAGNPIAGGTFGTPNVYAVGAGPGSIAIADINGDGKLDFMTSNFNAGTISLLLGNGDGTFGSRTDIAAGPIPVSATAADVSGDGRADLIYVNRDQGVLTVRFGNGDGTFQSGATYAVGNGTNSNLVDIFDADGDGAADIVVGDAIGNTISVLLNNGVGTFQPRVDFLAGGAPNDVTNGDFNRDGIVDLAVANINSGSVSVLIGNGDGTFQAKSDYSLGASSGPWGLDAADVNGDRIVDIVGANSGGNAISVMFGSGDGTFQSRVDYPTGIRPFRVALSDVDGDGDNDALINEYGSNGVSVLVNDGTGHFATRIPYSTLSSGPYEVASADVNADGRPDFIAVNADGNTVSVLLNQVTPVAGPVYVIDKNDAPVITSDGGGVSASVNVAENTTFVTTVEATDADAGQNLSYSIAGGADAARFAINSTTGALSFIAAPDFEAPSDVGGDNVYDVIVEVSDGNGGTDTQALGVSVDDIQEAPTGSPTSSLVNGTEDVAYTVSAADLLAGFSDPDAGDTLSVVDLTASTGAVTENGDGTWTITQAADFNGAVTLTYAVTDGNGGTLTDQSLGYTVAAVNDAPTGAPSTVLAAGAEDVAYTVSAADLLAGFTDVDGDTLVVANLAASNGTVIDNGDGTFRVTPAADFNGTMTLTYDVDDGNGGTLLDRTRDYSVTAVNDAAVIAGLLLGSVEEDTTLIAEGQMTITDVDVGEASFISGTFAGSYGTLELSSDGNWLYTVANGSAAVQELVTGQMLVDNVVVHSLDGTEQTISITINGKDEPPTSSRGQSVDGTAGNDVIDTSGIAGADIINAGAGNDTISTGSRDDLVQAGSGDDVVDAGSGNDTIFGDAGNDSLLGGDGDDTVYGGDGNDTINGGAGIDRITGGSGDDWLTGGARSDTFVFADGFGNDVVTDFDANPAGGQDLIELAGFGITVASFATRVSITDGGPYTLVTIDDDPNQTIRLEGIANPNVITIDDFLFS